jgi:hypothetical protein
MFEMKKLPALLTIHTGLVGCLSPSCRHCQAVKGSTIGAIIPHLRSSSLDIWVSTALAAGQTYSSTAGLPTPPKVWNGLMRHICRMDAV